MYVEIPGNLMDQMSHAVRKTRQKVLKKDPWMFEYMDIWKCRLCIFIWSGDQQT